MEMKFKVGDRVKFKTDYHDTAKIYDFIPTKEYEVLDVDCTAVSLKNKNGVSCLFDDFKLELYKPKQSKNKRIKSLEKQIITLVSRVEGLEKQVETLSKQVP